MDDMGEDGVMMGGGDSAWLGNFTPGQVRRIVTSSHRHIVTSSSWLLMSFLVPLLVLLRLLLVPCILIGGYAMSEQVVFFCLLVCVFVCRRRRIRTHLSALAAYNG